MATDGDRKMGKLTVTYRIISVCNDIEACNEDELVGALKDLPTARLDRIARALSVMTDLVAEAMQA